MIKSYRLPHFYVNGILKKKWELQTREKKTNLHAEWSGPRIGSHKLPIREFDKFRDERVKILTNERRVELGPNFSDFLNDVKSGLSQSRGCAFVMTFAFAFTAAFAFPHHRRHFVRQSAVVLLYHVLDHHHLFICKIWRSPITRRPTFIHGLFCRSWGERTSNIGMK